MVHSKARLAGNGRCPCQEPQRGCGAFVGLPSGEALSSHLRCCIGLTQDQLCLRQCAWQLTAQCLADRCI